MSTESSKSESQAQSFLPEQQKWLGQALEVYGPQLGAGQPIFGGQRLAPFGAGQEAALGQAGDFLGQFAPGGGMPMFGQTGTALEGILGGTTGAQPYTPESIENIYKRGIEEPAMRFAEKWTLPGIREEYAGPGYWGSARAGAVGEKRGEIGEWLGEQRAGLEWQTEQANRAIAEAKAGRALQAVPLGMEYAGQPTREALTRLQGTQGVFGMLGAGQQQRQAEINVAIQKFAEEHRLTDPESMQILLALLGMSYSTQSVSQAGPGLGYSMLTAAAPTLASGGWEKWMA